MNTIISEGAKKRLFERALRAKAHLEECSCDEEYAKGKKRLDEWCEIIKVLGLEKELRAYAELKKKTE